MKASLGAFGLAVLGSASAAAQQDASSVERADGASETGLQFALRAGLMLPFGKTAEEGTGYSIHHRSGASMSDSFSGFLPIWIEGGYRFNPNFFLGAFFQYAFGFTKNCDGGPVGSGSDLRGAAEGHYHLLPRRRSVPRWVL